MTGATQEKRVPVDILSLPPSINEISRIHSCLTGKDGLFMDKETLLLLTRQEVAGILGIPIDRGGDVGQSILGDLITREQLRWWSNLPGDYKGEGISLLSVFEYAMTREPKDRQTEDGQKKVLEIIILQVPNWRDRLRDHSLRIAL